MATALSIVEDGFEGLNICRASELNAEDATFGLKLLNRLLDNWNADRQAVYAETFSTFTATASLQPHTIGLVANAPTWNVLTNRPVSVTAANLITGAGTSAYRTPIFIRDKDWWDSVSLRAMTSAIPTDLYYEPTWPNGSLYFWPVPSGALSIELRLRVLLAQMIAATTFTLPPGYQDAITLTLEEKLVVPYHVTDQAILITLKKDARDARAKVFANNIEVPRLQTADAGMPGSDSGGGWDFRIGGYR